MGSVGEERDSKVDSQSQDGKRQEDDPEEYVPAVARYRVISVYNSSQHFQSIWWVVLPPRFRGGLDFVCLGDKSEHGHIPQADMMALVFSFKEILAQKLISG